MGRKLNLFRTVRGELKQVTTSEAKAYIMKVNQWNEDQYNKQRYLLKNKLRAYESFKRRGGASVKPQSPVELLYKTAKAKERQGASYRPSIEMRRIQSFTSIGSEKALRKAETGKRYLASAGQRFETYTGLAFQKFIETNPVAAKIFVDVKDPVKREQALKELANKLHAKQNEDGRVEESSAIPIGEVTGSDEFTDFDYSKYL